MRGYHDYLLLGLFTDLEPAGDAVAGLRGLGIRDDQITVMSNTPFAPSTIGRRRPTVRLVMFGALGALSGFLIGIFLTVGTPVLYPLDVSGQPLIPVPPSIIILFEYTLLSAMVFAFVRFMFDAQSPPMWDRIYDPRLTEDATGVLVGVNSAQAGPAEEVLRESGAQGLRRLDESSLPYRIGLDLARLRGWAVWGTVIAGSLIGIGILLVFAFGAIQFIYPDQMVTQPSVGYEQGPRLAAPTEAVPIQGPALVEGQPASEPLPATAASRERGATLFRINCVLCHGPAGRGDGPLAGFFQPPPADLLGPVVQSLPVTEIYRVISLGRGTMLSLAENLDPGERWDVVQLIKPASQPTPAATP